MNRDAPTDGGNPERPLLLTVREVCRLLARSRSRVYEMIRMRDIPHLRDGRTVLVPRAELDDWIRRKRRQTGC